MTNTTKGLIMAALLFLGITAWGVNLIGWLPVLGTYGGILILCFYLNIMLNYLNPEGK
jgi:hypothetical protein